MFVSGRSSRAGRWGPGLSAALIAAVLGNLAGGGPPPGDPVDGVRDALRAGDLPAAERSARAWSDARPADLRAAFYLGLSLHKLKRHAEALVLLERAEAASDAAFPESPHVSHYLGWCRYYLGDLVGARTAFLAHAAAFPEYDDTQFAIGLIAFDQDEVDEAERRFRRALELLERAGAAPGIARERAKCLARLGDVALRRGDLASAERDARAAVALWPDHHEAWAKLARVLDRQGRAMDAAAARAEQQAALARVAASGKAAP